MSSVDQFESVFRAADKDVLKHEHIEIRSVLVVTDLDTAGAEAFCTKMKSFLEVLPGVESWSTASGSDFETAEELLNLLDEKQPDLVCTYRNLHTAAWRFPHSLGVHLDVMLQRATMPVLVVPHPNAGYDADHALTHTDRVMAITDHLANDHHLVSYAAAMAQQGGTLFLAHIEDQAVFDRYIDAISKIPTIDTDQSRAELSQQLLKRPTDYIESCRDQLQAAGLQVAIEPIVAFGHHLSEFQEHIDSHQIDLLVMNAKDQEQLAMHGLAYPLVIELRQIPLLIL
jgi:nucleotide-binding universal stress UspA family protein